MKISYNWLQKYFEEKLPSPDKVADGIIFHSFEIEDMEKVGGDTIFDIKILPDRAHDCLSHWGIAKEISAIFGLKISSPSENTKQESGEILEIEVANSNCRRYMGRVIKGIKVKPSPTWLSEALLAIDQKSINNIVNATNYVMFDLGNPIHAFDLDKLASPEIIIEPAKKHEKIVLLDDKEITLDKSILTIRDKEEVLAIAGIKGGKKAEIDKDTKNIVIEVANFDPVSIRKTAKNLGIFTDSSKRFENEISPELAPMAMDKITKLILELAGGEPTNIVDVYLKETAKKTVNFNNVYLNNLLGVEITKEEINDILDRFGYEYKNNDGNYEVVIPPLRLDLIGPHDMAEEIGRIYGYDKIIPQLPKMDFKIKKNDLWEKIKIAREKLINADYKEIMTHTFRNEGAVEILASASDKKFLRKNLTDGLKESIKLNKINLPLLDTEKVKLFEIGTVFGKKGEEVHVCYGDEKNIVEKPLSEFISEEVDKGKLSSQKHDKMSDNSPGVKVFKPWSVYPFITRDIAVWVDGETGSPKVCKVIKENAGELLIKDPKLFDEFKKQDKISYAFRLVFQSQERTLTDEEINKIMAKIEEKISANNWQVR